MRNRILSLLFLIGIALDITSCATSPHQSSNAFPNQDDITGKTEDISENSLVIWWEQGYGVEANEAIAQLVDEWEQASGIETTLQLKPAPVDEQLKVAINQGNPPDIAFNGAISLILPQLAGTGQLADVSDVINPIQSAFNPNALAGASYLNQTTGQRSLYAIPTGMVTYNIHYWQPYLDRLGLTADDIPDDWQGFWLFWQEVRDQLHQADDNWGRAKDINSFCLMLSGDSHDGKETLALFLHGNNVEVFDQEGTLVLGQPQNRQGLINTFVQLSDMYNEGFILPEAIDWRNPDDNFHFLDRQCLLVVNGSLSIPSTQKLDNTPYNQNEQNRYVNEIVTLTDWPKTTNGSPFEIFIGTQVIVVPADATHPEEAKQFLSYLLQPGAFKQWNEELKGRFLPPMTDLVNTPFWQDPADPHFAAILDLQTKPTRPYPQALNPAYADIAEQEILTGALEKIIREGVSPEAAADEAIARVTDLVNQY